MDMTYAFALALGQARSCLAALAGTATTIDDSIQYDHVLLTLDLVHEDYPGCRRKGSAGWRSDCRNQRLSTRTARLGPTGEGEPPRSDLESGHDLLSVWV
jgi:hypothetical protein